MRPASVHNALILTSPSLIADHFVQEWLGLGNRIAAIWTGNAGGLRYGSERRLCAYAAGVRPITDHIRRLDIPVTMVDRITDTPDMARLVDETGADTLIIVLSGLIIPQNILAKFGQRAVNLHPALLPHYKGPVPRLGMLLDQKADQFGGVTVHRLSEKIDEGAIIAQRRVPWSESRDYVAWDLAAARAAADIVRNELTDYLDEKLHAELQDPRAGNYRKCGKYEFVISDDKPLAVVQSLFACAPGYVFSYMPRMPGFRKSYSVTALASVLGPPTGQAPVIGRFRIETDLLNARIRLVRKGIYHRTIGHSATKILALRPTGRGSGGAVELQ